jgi:hypothetical protein
MCTLVQACLLWYLIMSSGSALTLLLRGTTQLPSSFRQRLAALVLCYAGAAALLDVAMAVVITGFRGPSASGLAARGTPMTSHSRRQS